MSIAPIPSIAPALPPAATVSPAGRSAASAAAPGDSFGDSFGDKVTNALDGLAASHAEVDRLAVQAATGDLTAVHDFTIAASEAQLLTELTVEVRNRAVEAFNDIMRMQV